ncbi:ABC transporter permease [Collinsella sp. OF02-10]|uniref:ABC transporter permease subunit n=1 Tax=Collinsella sp. OF02-10 TaxID=2292324 RepID=UPI000E4CB147|nr:ABC transporter permease subunit [Collinsella sp. OF02-10]RGY30898.1 ABC transporter permease [Collinsella sp. OF02-10]
MRSLVWFELKKMLSRRIAIAMNVGVLVLLAGVMALNVAQTKTENAAGEVLSGTDAIAYAKAEREAHAGAITPEQAAADIAAYQDEVFSQIDADAVLQMTGSAVYSLMLETYGQEGTAALYDPYWTTLLNPWRAPGQEPAQTAALVTPEMAADWYGAVAQMTQDALDEGQGGMWEYSDAERAYWTGMQASVAEPIEYGYVGGWGNIVDCVAFLSFAILAVCVTLAPVFSFEYQSGADAVVLSARHGRGRLVAAKVLASLLWATVYFAACAAVVIGVSLAFYGADGFWLSVQNISLSSPYPISAGQAALISVGLMYAVCIGFACLTLALSSRTRSTLSVFVVDVVLILLTGLVPSAGVGVIERVLALFPTCFSNFNMLFAALESYSLGPFVVDLVGMVAAVYVLLALVAAPISIASFRMHQVS